MEWLPVTHLVLHVAPPDADRMVSGDVSNELNALGDVLWLVQEGHVSQHVFKVVHQNSDATATVEAGHALSFLNAIFYSGATSYANIIPIIIRSLFTRVERVESPGTYVIE